MGNEIGNPASKLGITSLAVTTPNIELPALEKMRSLLRKISADKQSEKISRDEFAGVLKQMDKFTPPDAELFTQLFTLFDEDGHETVDYKGFLAGAAVVFSSAPSLDKLKFALSLYDLKETHMCVRSDIKKALLAINSTAAYFGDPVLSVQEIETLLIDLFADPKNLSAAGMPIEEVALFVTRHHLAFKFMSGQGAVRFGSPELRA